MVPRLRKEVSLNFFSHSCPWGRKLIYRVCHIQGDSFNSHPLNLAKSQSLRQVRPDSTAVLNWMTVQHPPTPHKGGIPTELPPWKKGCHQTKALEYTIWRPHIIPWHHLIPWHHWCHQVSVIFRPRWFQRHGPAPPPFPCRYILCSYSMLYCSVP